MESSDLNPYEAPKADLDVVIPPVAGGSLENAIAGRYDFSMGEVMSEAWRLTKGFKASFWGAFVVIELMYVAGLIVTGVVLSRFPNIFLSLAVNLLLSVLMTPLHCGLFMMAVRRAGGQPVDFGTAFAFYDRAGTLIGAMVMTTLLTCVGCVFLLVPGIYLGVAYLMAVPLIGDRRLPAWQAMETSRKALTHKWWPFFGVLCVVYLVISSVSVLLIPLVWMIPWALLVMGVLYRRIFGMAEDAAPNA